MACQQRSLCALLTVFVLTGFVLSGPVHGQTEIKSSEGSTAPTVFQQHWPADPNDYAARQIWNAELLSHSLNKPVDPESSRAVDAGGDSRSHAAGILLSTGSPAGKTGGEQLPVEQLVNAGHWFFMTMLGAVAAAMLIKWWRTARTSALAAGEMEHLGTLPISNQFRVHLLKIGSTQFLITTDRGGVRTVNPVSSWEGLDTPVDFPEPPAAHSGSSK